MEYEQITSKILKQLRGVRSQIQISKELGYSYNQFAKWESNQRKIRWRDFVKLCSISGFPLEKTLDYSLKFALRSFDPSSAAEIIQQFLLTQGLNDLTIVARRLRVHPSALRRWLSREVDPSLESIFQIMDLTPDFLDLFLKRLNEVNPGFEQTDEPNSLEDLQLKYITQFPWALTVLTTLELDRFRLFSNKQIPELAELISIHHEVVTKSIEDLCRLKIIKKNDELYQLVKSKFQIGNLPIIEILKPIHYWTEKLAKRIGSTLSAKENERPPGLVYFSDYRVMAVSQTARDEINKTIADFIGQIKEIYENQRGPKEQVCCFLLHHFQPGITSANSNFENDWMKNRPEALYWSERITHPK